MEIHYFHVFFVDLKFAESLKNYFHGIGYYELRDLFLIATPSL